MKLSGEERDFMQLVFEETGGIPLKYIAPTELPLVAEALSIHGMVDLRRRGPDTWT
jgi:hypothetical protein